MKAGDLPDNKWHRSEFFINSDMLISVYDKDLNLIDANNAFLKGLHLRLEDILGKNISEISPDCKDSGRYALYENVIRTGHPLSIDQVRLHPTLGGLYLRLNAFRLGEGLGIASRDITDLMETIGDLETFISRTSHEVRSPISTILGLVNVARNDLAEDETARNYLDLIAQQARNLDKIVMRLSETSSIRQTEIKVQQVDFHDKIGRILDSLSSLPGYDRVRVRTDVRITSLFFSDRTLLNLILHHLIHNAIRFRDERKQVCDVLVQIAERQGGILIQVEDNGIGVPGHLQKNLFNMFFKASSVGGGSGLGLYTVRHSVKKLGGYINMESRPGLGSSFKVFVPNKVKEARDSS